MSVCEKVSRELNCQKWLFTNVKINPINMKLIAKINDKKKIKTFKKETISGPKGVSKALRTCHWSLLYIKKNGKNNHKNHNSNIK